MKLKQAPVGTVVQTGNAWASFTFPGEEHFPDRLEIVERTGNAVLCRPVAGGQSGYFYGELEVRR